MIQAVVRHPSALQACEIAAWRECCAAAPAFANPLLGPDFAQLVGEVRADARVAMFEDGDRPVGFLAFHRQPSGFARPIGSAFSDYHALVTAPGAHLDGGQALAAAGVGSIRFTGLVDPHRLFGETRPADCPGYVIDLKGSAEAHNDVLRESNPKRFKNWKRLQNKLEREWGEVVLTPADTSQEAFDQLVAWKREQFQRTGAHDVMRPQWARALFQTTFERRDGDLRGVMTTLRAGGKLVAGHFGVAAGGVCHAWLSSMDPACSGCGPGQVLMLQTPEIMTALGLHTYDFGPGYAHYKAPFASREVAITEVMAMADGRASLAARSLNSVWALAGERRIDAVGRLRRRLDHIAAAEVSVGGQVRGVVEAIAGYGRRSASREPERAAPVPEQA